MPRKETHNGFKFFMSSDFKHGKEIVVDNESFYRMNYDNNKIYKTDSQGTINISDEGKILNEKPLIYLAKTYTHNYLHTFHMD